MSILNPNISENDTKLSNASIDRFLPYLKGTDRSLVFFVGAGASMAGNTGMPSTPSLIYQLLLDSLAYSEAFEGEFESYKSTLKEISSKLGFEITLNDFWQICREATASLYSAFADLETQCKPNRVHTFLANWLATGGTVVTTNYDRLIEREWAKISSSTKSLISGIMARTHLPPGKKIYRTAVAFSKFMVRLDEPSSCFGALEHVGTQLSGNRAELLLEIIQNRPICFVGWRGIDPDIPPLIA